MNLNSLKSYAQRARREFIAAVTERAVDYGLTESGDAPLTLRGDIALINGRAFPGHIAAPRSKLVIQIRQDGFAHVMDEMAYTWFNRFAAIRFMELNGLLGHGMRVLSHPRGETRPEILKRANEFDLPGLDRNQVRSLMLDGTRDEELYRLLLVAQCNALSRATPLLFDPIGMPTGLLLPRNLLRTNSLVRRLVDEIEESAWRKIEVVGWLYQFYISEKKDEVIGKVVKSEDIPAATQLFTPNWIVKYLVQNSLGALWLATYPDSSIAQLLEYYIAPAKQSIEVRATLAAITPDVLNPEELTVIDPAVGSGHMLVEAYDLLKAIYLERGYRRREIALLILEKNLYGLDIDPRATQLASFALLMKGLFDDRRLLERGVDLNVVAIESSAELDVGQLVQGVKLSDYGLAPTDLVALKNLYLHATTFGSLINVPEELAVKMPRFRHLCKLSSMDAFVSNELRHLRQLVRQTEVLTGRYDVVVANPPYMGSKYQTPHLKNFLKENFEGYAKDLFSAFIDRNLTFGKRHAQLGFMTPFVWMFISTHKHLRQRIVGRETITTLVQLEYSGFAGATVPICVFTLQKDQSIGYKGCFIRLSGFRGPRNQAPKTREAIRNRNCGWFFEATQSEFKKIPGSPIVYWISDHLRELFANGKPLGKLVDARQGLATADNDLFLRRWWEVDIDRCGFRMKSREEALHSGKKWFPYNKGGKFRKWYGNHEYVVNWKDDGRAIRAFGTEDGGRPRSRVQNSDYYFRSALTWSDVSSGPRAFRLNQGGSIHGNKGHSAFGLGAVGGEEVAGYCNSPIVRAVARALNPTLSFEIGDFQQIPSVAEMAEHSRTLVKQQVSQLMLYARTDWNAFERSWEFQSLPILGARSERESTIESSYATWVVRVRQATAKARYLEEENNRLFIDACGFSDELSPEVPLGEVTLTVNPAYRYKGSLCESEQWSRFCRDSVAELVSYAIGCMMGRYSLDQPGLVYAKSRGKGFDPAPYSSFPADEDGIVPITTDAWFDDDAANRLTKLIATAWDSAHLEDNLAFVADSLSPRRNESSRDTLRRYLATGFYKDHLTTYKNRPIYWLSTSGRRRAFQCLVYLHRYNEGTLARMRTDYVIPLQGKMDSRIRRLNEDIEAATKAHHRGLVRRLEKERENLLKDQVELRMFDDKLRYYADQRINLDLDDGVKVNYGKFGDLLSDVRKVTGIEPAPWK